MNATDPVNLAGLVTPGASVTAIRTNRVVYVDGLPQIEGAGDAGTPTETVAERRSA